MKKEVLEEIRSKLHKARRVVFLGGAGVSTGSGIPDFRSPQGLYNIHSKYGVPYEVMLSHSYFIHKTETFYDFYWSTMVAKEAKPNKAHRALAEYSKNHQLVVITQNIDGLDKQAGSKTVLEMHGTTWSYHCMDCQEHYSLDRIDPHGVPHCSHCGGILKPDVVLYEEPLDEDTLLSAINAVRFADFLIVGGTSMKVYPVAGLPSYFPRTGPIVMINAEPTEFDACCDYVIHEDIGDTLEALLSD